MHRGQCVSFASCTMLVQAGVVQSAIGTGGRHLKHVFLFAAGPRKGHDGVRHGYRPRRHGKQSPFEWARMEQAGLNRTHFGPERGRVKQTGLNRTLETRRGQNGANRAPSRKFRARTSLNGASRAQSPIRNAGRTEWNWRFSWLLHVLQWFSLILEPLVHIQAFPESGAVCVRLQ